ncbi:MAG: TatD family hydrolase [Verrucomicrobiales bacterium]|nr:TatD family hydrolase [Verrucomicrobiales bacterium]
MLRLYDAHNHLQVEKFAPRRAAILDEARQVGLIRMVVNGADESDWPAVLELARQHPSILPSFGLHPRYIRDRTQRWNEALRHFLDAVGSAVGEIGLDRWIEHHDFQDQEDVFVWQLRLAAERNLPVTIHCLRAWGRLLELLQGNPRPERGFLLHSYGGSREMVGCFAKLGAYFSISGQFALDWKKRQRETFRYIPEDRLLIETDAPFMPLPEKNMTHRLTDSVSGQPLNHPANIRAVYEFVAELLGKSTEDLAVQIEQNFLRLFEGF